MVILSGCDLTGHSHQPGVPYYFESGVTYQGFRPTGEITEPEANKLASSGYAYYIAYFNQEGKPTKIFKVYEGSTNLYMQLEFGTNDIQKFLEYQERKKEKSR